MDTLITLHCTHYQKPLEQRQIVRILLMAPLYSIISFFGYRYYKEYISFGIIRDCYEAFVLASFLILCLLYVGRSPLEQHEVMTRKEKSKLSFPFCCWYFRPSKPYFLVAVKWIFNVFCGASYDYRFANVWLTAITFISVSVALYGLLLFYHLVADDLAGHRPMMKFLSIKVAIFLVFYQTFVFSVLSGLGYIKASRSWTADNVADGLNALCVTIEMAIVAIVQLFAFPYTEYAIVIKGSGRDRTPFWSSFAHSQDYRDFLYDITSSIRFFIDRWRGKAYTRSPSSQQQTHALDFQAAFGLGRGLRHVGGGLAQFALPKVPLERRSDEDDFDDGSDFDQKEAHHQFTHQHTYSSVSKDQSHHEV
ncbi:organic solute transporter Ostalpha-domain-containing protein [Melampsora americana]|nr:organic solute transporter Ostalpha-domain-containing protein [Melampsora americana]